MPAIDLAKSGLRFLARALLYGVAFGGAALLVGAICLFVFGQIAGAMPFGSAFFWANVGIVVALLVALTSVGGAVTLTASKLGITENVEGVAPALILILSTALGLTLAPPPSPLDTVTW